MTKEELEIREKLKLQNIVKDWLKTEHREGNIQSLVNLILSFAEPREKQIEIDAKQIRALQKQNGELTDELTKKSDTNHQLVEQMAELNERCSELEEELTLIDNECKDMREELKQRIRENQKLCEQIEKMKQELDNAREEANRQEQWELYSVLNGIYNDNFEVITSVSN